MSAASNRSAVSVVHSAGGESAESGVNIFDPPDFSSTENLLAEGDEDYTPNILDMNDGESLTDSQSHSRTNLDSSKKQFFCVKTFSTQSRS